MIETYAFIAAFLLQIIVFSLLQPIWFARAWRAEAAKVPAARHAELHQRIFRHFARYRWANAAVGAIGICVLGGLISYAPFQAWDDITRFYFMLQVTPIVIATLMFARALKAIGSVPPEAKRKAVMQRRGLFDFVSPLTVAAALLSYLLYVAYVLYIAERPFPGFAGALVNIGAVTLLYLFTAFWVWHVLYGKKAYGYESHEDRIQGMRLATKIFVYSCFFYTVGLSIDFTISLFELHRWKPFASSAGLGLIVIFGFIGLNAPARRHEAAEPGISRPV